MDQSIVKESEETHGRSECSNNIRVEREKSGTKRKDRSGVRRSEWSDKIILYQCITIGYKRSNKIRDEKE